MKKILFIFIIIFLFFIKSEVKANSSCEVYILYDYDNLNIGSEVVINITSIKFNHLIEAIIRFDGKDIFEVSNPFYFNQHSIFNDYLINKVYDNNIAYLELYKPQINEGYHVNYKNNLCCIKLKLLKQIDNINIVKEMFKIYLFNEEHNLINYTLKNDLKLNGSFTKDYYEVSVFEPINLLKYFNVSKDCDYELIIEKEIDFNKCIEQIYQIGLYDLITGCYESYSCIINVKDLTPPQLIFFDQYFIEDTKIDYVLSLDLVDVVDNYDNNVKVEYIYYDLNKNLLAKNNVVDYLKTNYQCYVKVNATDSSCNTSSYEYIKYIIKDTTPPNIDIPKEINIEDINLSSFNILDYIKIQDNIDENPKLVIDYYLNDNIVLFTTLSYDTSLICKIKGFDESNNLSCEYSCIINLIDKTKPKIIVDDNLTINDTLLASYDFKKAVIFEDNNKSKINTLSLEIKYFLEEEVQESDFMTMLSHGNFGYLIYIVKDANNNEIQKKVNVTVIDTTKPSILVNVEENKIYENLDFLEINCTDNFGECRYEVYIDNTIYNKEELSLGKHTLMIVATDTRGNQNKLELSFVISNKGYLYNIINGNIKWSSNLIIMISLVLSFIILIINIIYHLKKRVHS